MKKTKKLNSLHFLINEDISNLLATQGPQEQTPITDLSLDEKVDHYLIQYERESAPMSAQYQVESKVSLKALMGYLFEAPQDEEPEEDDDTAVDVGGDDALGGDLGGDVADAGGGLDFGGGGFGGGGGGGGGLGDLGGDTGGGSPEKGPAPVPTPQINISNFAKNVARLINNYQSLLDPKRVILNRTRAYAEKNYNPQVAKELMSILDTEYSLSAESLSDKERELETPIAAGALEPLG